MTVNKGLVCNYQLAVNIDDIFIGTVIGSGCWSAGVFSLVAVRAVSAEMRWRGGVGGGDGCEASLVS